MWLCKDGGNATYLSRAGGRLPQGPPEPDLRGVLAFLLTVPLKSSSWQQVVAYYCKDKECWVLFPYFPFFFLQIFLPGRLWQTAEDPTGMENIATLSQWLITQDRQHRSEPGNSLALIVLGAGLANEWNSMVPVQPGSAVCCPGLGESPVLTASWKAVQSPEALVPTRPRGFGLLFLVILSLFSNVFLHSSGIP